MKTFKWGVSDPVPIKAFVIILVVLLIIPIYVFNSNDSILGVFLFLAFFPIYLICTYKIIRKSLKGEVEMATNEKERNNKVSRIKPVLLIFILCFISFIVYQWVLSDLAEGFRH